MQTVKQSGIHPYKREDITYVRPSPIQASKSAISNFAEKIAQKLQFRPGNAFDDVILRLGGKIHYLYPEQLEATESGSILVHKVCDFEIFLSSLTGSLRDRFTIAHELGHYFLHSDQGETPIQVERNGSDRLEWEANWFAAAFLMPESEVKTSWEKYKNISVLSTYFQVSYSAMSVRLQNLSLI
ncbi:ImmA/IrrE family metallo-endopeptidase [Leptospira noguchii]|uniref:ImmA/IrrE family metallo-endopeptidase n=1 Tax=Leptospira noguchii TaxID=28182 RepID=UPI0007740811|nr:ImmA/IrrE family metallo-endopeptidase [Leptospira noguchii]